MSEKTPLTVADPVSQEDLAQLAELDKIKGTLALKLMALEQEKIKFLTAAKRVEDQFQRIFETILVDRGLPPDTLANIDTKTGKISVTGTGTPKAEEKAETGKKAKKGLI